MKIRHVCAEQPDTIPKSWTICNAPRPIYGTRVWTGPFITGRLYAAISPEDLVEHPWMMAHNTRQDAVELWYHTEEVVVAIALEYLSLKYPDTIDELDQVKERKYLISTGLRLLNEE